jgi:hypothetical protein
MSGEVDTGSPIRACAKATRPHGDEAMMLTGPGILLMAACVFAAIWIVVLWGSRYFGPQ